MRFFLDKWCREQLESVQVEAALSEVKYLTVGGLIWVAPKCTLQTWTEVESLDQDNRNSLNCSNSGALQAAGSSYNKESTGLMGLLKAAGEIEAGREDRELPSSAAPLLTTRPGTSSSKLSSGKDVVLEDVAGSGLPLNSRKEALDTSSKGSSGERRSRREKTAAVKPSVTPREGATLAGLGSSLGTEFDALMEDGMDGLELDSYTEEAPDDSDGSRSRWGWELHGAHRYRAVLRRENGPAGKRLELEALVCADVVAENLVGLAMYCP